MSAYPVHIGARFGDLTVLSITDGKKYKASLAKCLCVCGNHQKVRLSQLRTAKIIRCKTCNWRAAWSTRPRTSDAERFLARRETEYKTNAVTKGLLFTLSRAEFRTIITSPCDYCGTPEAHGIDRIDSGQGYLIGNVVPCCSNCNYAKRSLSKIQFLDMVERIYRHSIEGQK